MFLYSQSKEQLELLLVSKVWKLQWHQWYM